MTNKSPFQFDTQAPLIRIHPETRKANDALRDYWQMGSGRSLRKLIEQYHNESSTESSRKTIPPTIHFCTLGAWSTRFRWQDRILRAKEMQDKKDDAMFEKARLAVRVNALDDYTKLRDLANEILDKGPDFLKTTTRHIRGKWEKVEGKDGRMHHVQLSPDREIVTVALDGRLALQAIKLATNICREAALVESGKGMTIEEIPQGASVTITLPDNQRGDRKERS